jgi:hypothetical protein
MSLRTRTVPVDLPADERERCPNCNAVLRPSNHGLCAPCAGVRLPELTDWQRALMNFGGNHGVKMVARGLGAKGPSKWHKQTERDAEIRRMWEAGESTAVIARAHGLSWYGANNIVRGFERGERAPEMK